VPKPTSPAADVAPAAESTTDEPSAGAQQDTQSAGGASTAVSAAPRLAPATSVLAGFEFGQARPARRTGTPTPPPTLGPLAAFVGDWQGNGFNTIFRPDSPETPTPFPNPVPPSDNVLELNLTAESLSFSKELGTVPNRGMVQADISLNGVPYLQSIEDVNIGPPKGIHLEPGLWVIVPPTSAPPVKETSLVRMASIPHGTTICAQGTFKAFTGAPNIPAVDITPFIAGSPGQKIRFASQTAADGDTPRIPQDLTPFINAGTITQAILDDPNTVLRNHNSKLDIVSTTEITIATAPTAPLFGGGTDNIAFLLGDPGAITKPDGPGQNAQTLQMHATFWIEEVQYTIVVPPYEPGRPPLTLRPENDSDGQHAPTFIVRPPIRIESPREITITTKQIQYSQTVELNFNGLTWPHVSVATLVPATPPTIPPSAWA
jgi:hypothetical protein